nr:MAG TPA: hypothetical protein [Caudoviricetes sp.]
MTLILVVTFTLATRLHPFPDRNLSSCQTGTTIGWDYVLCYFITFCKFCQHPSSASKRLL